MVPSSLDGLTDEQLAELEAQQGQPEITTGLMDRLSAAPSPTKGFTEREMEALPVLASTPFAAQRGIALPPEAPAEPEPMTDYELNQLEEENYRRVDYIMPEEEFRQYWTRRKEESNEVGRFIEGVGQGAAGMLAMIPEAGREIRDGMVGMVTDPVNQVQRNVQTGAEIVRKAGINMVQLFDWVGNKVNDVGTWARRRGLKQQALAKQLEQQGKLTGDELRDAEIIAAASSEADAMEPTPLEEEEDFQRAYERYQREKALEQEFAGVTDFQIGTSRVGAAATSKDAYQITNEQPAETMSMLGSMVVDPVNLLPVGAGALSKLRVLRRTATLAGAPLRGLERVADATADLAERAEFGISSRVQDITGLTAKQQAALGAGAAGAAVYADAAGGGGNVTAAVTAIGSVLPGLRYGGAIIRKTGAAAGGAATIIREAGVGGIGAARAEAAADLSRMTAIPERYRKYFTGYVDGTDSTLKRVAQDAGNPEALRRVARFSDRAGVTTAARLADDVTSGAVAAGITGAPFAALQPDAERAGEVLGGIMALGGVAGAASSAVRRGTTAADADIARMMADVYAVGGNVDALSALPHATLDRMAAMQGVLAGKVDFVPLKADEYRMNKDVSATGGELAAGLFLEKDANGRARVFINLDARKAAGGVEAIAPHEIGHAILTSNVLDGQPRNDLRNLVNQQYGPDGVTARGREYVSRLVDADIQNGTTGELPQVLTEQEFRDLESGNRSAADIAKARKMEPSERERLINERYEELSQRSIERGEDALDWARDEIIAETFASEAPAIDFRAIRRDAAFPRLAESMLATGGRVLEMMGVRLDSGTGRMLDNPSVLFRDNPLFQDRIMQRRVKEYVRAYDQYLAGLEEAGSATPRGVELARSSRPDDLARSTHVKLRDEGRGVLENDFLFQRPDGTYSFKPQRIINAAEANRAAQIKTLYDAKKFVPVNSTEFGKRKVNGREVIGGPVLPPQFDLFTQFPQHVREFARAMEASRAEGGSWNIDYNAIGTGSSGRYRITNMGAVRAIQRETVPFGWQVTKQNHLLAASLDLNAFRSSAMKAINKGELGIFNNDMKQVEADLKTYLANHRNGMPGEATIGQQKRDTLNGLIGTGTAVQRAANPLYAELNPKGSIRTWRIDRLNDAQPSGRTGYFFDYDKINNNRMPQQIPREAQGMPDVAAQDAFEYAKRNHGTTRSIYEAGYVLPDGTMLDFSGKNDAGGYERKPDGNFGPQSGQRDYLRDTRNSDHREIRFSESQDFGGGEAMTEFMRKGAVRVDANSGLISIHGRQRLTSAQKSAIKDIVRSKDSAWLDLEDDAGNRTSLELKSGKWAPVEGLLNQWADGKTPRPRAQFMPDAATYLDREYNPAELAARAKREGYELVYHGDRNQPASDKYKPWTKAKLPLFTSFDSSAADWFGDPRPLFVKASKVAGYDDMIAAARRSGVKGTYGERGEQANIPEVRKHSTYEGYNENDLLYIPQVREELRKQGFDAVRVFDQLERDEIDALIVIGSPDQVVDPLKTQGRGQAMPDAAPADAPPFYMKSTQVLDAKIQGKAATVDQVRAILTNPQNGIKAEELKWTGALQAAERLAKENNGKVPKDALLQYLADDGAVRLEEVVGLSPNRVVERNADGTIVEGQRPDFSARFGQYQLPGGENYREVVLAMPDPKRELALLEAEYKEINSGQRGPITREMTDRLTQLNMRKNQLEDAAFNAYTSRHFDTPNYVAHMRLNERTDAAGKPGLFLEEVQSDRHQAGREQGYREPFEQWIAFYDAGGTEVPIGYGRSEKQALESIDKNWEGLVKIQTRKRDGVEGIIPDAPFRKDWPVQMFKRALADAVSSGKEWIGWTTGETQAARYDLSKQVKSIDVIDHHSGQGRFVDIRGKDGESVMSMRYNDKGIAEDGKPLSDYIGKELAEKVMKLPSGKREGSSFLVKRFSGIDLKVGGEGMKGFYDQILPKEISKYVKQWGAQVEKARIGQPKKHSGKLTRDELAEAKRDAKALINGDIDVAEFNDNWGTRLTDDDVPGSDPYRLNESATDLVSVVRKERELDAGGTFEAWRVSITPQMREGIKKAGQALFVGGMAAVVAEQEEQ